MTFNRSLMNRGYFNRTAAHYDDVTATVYARGSAPSLAWTTSVTATVYLPAVMYYQMIDWVAVCPTATVYLPAVMYYQMIDWGELVSTTTYSRGVEPTANVSIETDGTVYARGSVSPVDWVVSVDPATVYLPAVMYYQMIDWNVYVPEWISTGGWTIQFRDSSNAPAVDQKLYTYTGAPGYPYSTSWVVSVQTDGGDYGAGTAYGYIFVRDQTSTSVPPLRDGDKIMNIWLDTQYGYVIGTDWVWVGHLIPGVLNVYSRGSQNIDWTMIPTIVKTVYPIPIQPTGDIFVPALNWDGSLCVSANAGQSMTDKMMRATFNYVTDTSGSVADFYFGSKFVNMDIPDYIGALQRVFVGFFPSGSVTYGADGDMEVATAFDFSWYLTMQYLSKDTRSLPTPAYQLVQKKYMLNYRDPIVWRLEFTDGSVPFTVGTMITGGTTDATANVASCTVTSGLWATLDAAGFLAIEPTDISDTFDNGEWITSGSGATGQAKALHSNYTSTAFYWKTGDFIIGTTSGNSGLIEKNILKYPAPHNSGSYVELTSLTGTQILDTPPAFHYFIDGEILKVNGIALARAAGYTRDITGTVNVTYPHEFVCRLLGGDDTGSLYDTMTRIIPYRITSVSWSSTSTPPAIEFIFDEKTTKMQAIERLCKYLRYVFFVKIVGGFPCAYFIPESAIDDAFVGLDLPAAVTITPTSVHLVSPVTLERKGEEKYTKVTVRCQTISPISGIWLESVQDSGSFPPIEYREITQDIATQDDCDQRCADLYAYYSNQVLTYKATFIKRSDFRLLQKLVFSGDVRGIPNDTYRIVGIDYQYADAGTTNEVTCTLVADTQFQFWLNLNRVFTDLISEMQAVVQDELNKLGENEVATVLSIDVGAKTMTVQTESGVVKTVRNPGA